VISLGDKISLKATISGIMPLRGKTAIAFINRQIHQKRLSEQSLKFAITKNVIIKQCTQIKIGLLNIRYDKLL